MEDLEKLSYECGSVSYVTFELPKMKQSNNFVRDYTLCVSPPKKGKSYKRVKKCVPRGMEIQKKIGTCCKRRI